MIRRLLIANRGEIALRIIRACRELGIESVAVYSEADGDALHTVAADRAISIGPAPASESYLAIPRLLEAAAKSRADAVHPGYGFLGESASFADACKQAGLTFVGPPADVIARMGSKVEARRVMSAAGVPIVPGRSPENQSDEALSAAVEAVGLPALIKAVAGGGGRGMRRILTRDGIVDAVRAARREATAAFGEGALYIERLFESPHHIEVQIFADGFGNVVHLFERDCSAQRRHQKIVEESPAPLLTGRLRDRLTAAAVAAGRAAGYLNAGTVEFLVPHGERSRGDSEDAQFYFLEMNTRIQVEHPVTEEVTGLDLVRGQLLVASGQPLPWRQDQVRQRGHAIEARIYAEDPSADFAPQAGRLMLYREPRMPGLRIDSGFAEGGSIPVHYDPMIAKVIATAESRALAIDRLVTGLRAFPILGVRTNIPFLLRLLERDEFRAGRIDTGFVDRERGELTDTAMALPPHVRAVIDAARSDEAPPLTAGRAPGAGWDPWNTTA